MIIKTLGAALGWIMRGCFALTKSYGWSIIIFTFLTKIILFPLSLLTQKNSIKMVQMMPEENALKIKYIDDKDKLADERLALYKKYKYNPMLSTVPLLLQIPLVLGLVYVIYRPLSYVLGIDASIVDNLREWLISLIGAANVEDNTYQVEIINRIKEGILPTGDFSEVISKVGRLNMKFCGFDLSQRPSFKENLSLLLVPLLSGLSAWLLCEVQNKINVLQVTQGKLNKFLTTAFMVAFSTYFAFLVPAGVGLYWIFGNFFGIPVMYLLNVVMPPKKYVDLDYLNKINEQRIEKEKVHKQYKSREKADYQRFFEVKDMQLMIYSEQSGFYKYFEDIIDYVCEHSDIQIHYVTSDPNDVIFKDERKQISSYYVASDQYLVPLFMKLDCRMCLLTVPDLEKYHLKRSRVRKDIEYVFVSHGMGSVALTLRKGALNWYDTVFCPGPDTLQEIRDAEELYNTPKKRLVETGYPLIDKLLREYEASEHKENEVPKILIAPSWQPDNIIDMCAEKILDELSKTNYQIILRPHPQQVRHQPEKFDVFKEKYEDCPNIEIQTDFSSNSPIMESDILITDWSDISWEYAFVTKRPILFINTPMKVMNPEWEKIKTKPINIALRDQLGKSLDPDKLDNISGEITDMLSRREEYREQISRVFSEHVYNIGKSKILCGKYIIKSLERKV